MRIIYIQARVSSTRLPAKVLLPINGVPLVVQAYNRATNLGDKAFVLTSTDESDDILADILTAYNVPFFRGDLKNTLKRYVDASKNLTDDTQVVRLTADNFFPDGGLIHEVVEYFERCDLDYLLCNGEESGLPYGVSLEVFKVKHLRESYSACKDAYNQEHVTPYIRNSYGVNVYERYFDLNLGDLCATIDTLDNYLALSAMTSKFQNLSTTPVFDLIEELKYRNVAKKFIVGGAQIGLDYGITNNLGKPENAEVCKILETAESYGVKLVDTARAYGNSESIIGDLLSTEKSLKKLRAITKLDVLDLNLDVPLETQVKMSITESKRNLRLDKLPYLLIHRASHLWESNGELLEILQKFSKDDQIGEIGVSIQTPSELTNVLKIKEVSIIQLPYNLLDSRWEQSIDQIVAEKKKRKLTIHIRSIFLQGLLLSDQLDFWRKANFIKPQEIVEWLHSMRVLYDKKSVQELCISYVLSQSWVDGIVVGVNSHAEFVENMTCFTAPLFSREQLANISKSRPVLSDKNLNPSFWQL